MVVATPARGSISAGIHVSIHVVSAVGSTLKQFGCSFAYMLERFFQRFTLLKIRQAFYFQRQLHKGMIINRFEKSKLLGILKKMAFFPHMNSRGIVA
jgi:hypothetical protein